MPKVIIVGGGFAGLSAAAALAEAGLSVELYESRSYLGGRSYSMAPSKDFPAPVDNGPHLFMGCYVETFKFLSRIGVKDAFQRVDPLSLTWLTPGGGKVSLKCASLPAPLHLSWGLFFSNAFPWREKISLTQALFPFRKKPFVIAPGIHTVSQYLNAVRQGPAVRERFWLPLCDSAMNSKPETAPIKGLGEVLHRLFFGRRRNSALVLAKVPLSNLASESVCRFLKSRRGNIHLHEAIQAFKAKKSSFELKTHSGRSLTADALILAVPPSSLSGLLKGSWRQAPSFARLGKSPIVSVHLVLSKPVLEEPLVGLSGAKFQWVFNRNSNWGWNGEGQYLSFTASAAEGLIRLKDRQLADLAFQELTGRCAAALDVKILHSKTTREMAATIAWSPNNDFLRPPCETPFKNVFLAGDWTDTALPATLESACLSGHRAAEKIREILG